MSGIRTPSGGALPSPELLQKWSHAPSWRPLEGVALAFGVEPQDLRDARSYGHPRLRARSEIEHYCDLARRAVEAGDLLDRPRPSQFVAWADRVCLRFDERWREEIGDHKSAEPDRHSEAVRETVGRTAKKIALRDKLIEKWALAPSWTHAEGAALSMNLPPSVFDDGPSRDSLLDIEHKRRLSFAQRAHAQHQLYRRPTPAEFVSWAATVGFPFDEEWVRTVGAPSPRPTP